MIGFTTQNLKGKKLIQNGKKRFWKMESHMVASQPGSGSCSKRNLWGTKFSFTSVKRKKNGEMNVEKIKTRKNMLWEIANGIRVSLCCSFSVGIQDGRTFLARGSNCPIRS